MSRKRKAELSDSGSEYEDASHEQKKPRRAVKVRKTQTKTQGKRRGKADASNDAESDLESGEMLPARPHAAAMHLLASPGPSREALLQWYDGVHAVRGMPWRKPYQHSWDAEEKAQRAYEVCRFHFVPPEKFDMNSESLPLGLGFGDHAPANASCHRDTLL